LTETVLVTGATGFIGAALCRALCSQGLKVRALHRSTSSLAALQDIEVERVVGDILDPESLAPAMRGARWVFHTATQSDYWRQPDRVWRSAVDGTRNVVEAARATKVERLIHTSSLAAVGVPDEGELLDEQHAFNLPRNRLPYGHAKHHAEQQALERAGDGLDVVIVNPSVVMGAGDIHQISGSMVVEAARGLGFVYTDGGVNVVHIADVVDGHLAAAQRGRSGERYILGGENLTHRRIFTILADIVGRRPPWLRIPGWAITPAAALLDLIGHVVRLPMNGDQLWMSGHLVFCDTTKARTELGLAAPRPFRQAAQEAYDWYRAQGVI
jgi:dihydroflavonol-4-reductase